MIYVFAGSDFGKVAMRAGATVHILREKKPDASIVAVAEPITENLIRELTESQGLFERKLVAVFEHVLDDSDTFAIIAPHLPHLAESENIFIFKEGVLPKKTREKVETHAVKIAEFDISSPQEKYSDFALADALGRREKKKAWILLVEAYGRGVAPEALHGMLFWKLKTMLLKKSFRDFPEGELRKKMTELVTLYHEARRGRGELSEKLEAFVLGV